LIWADAEAIAALAWAQTIAPDSEMLAIVPTAVPVSVCPGNGWQHRISRHLPPALLLPTVELAIAATGGQDDAIESAPVSASLAIDRFSLPCLKQGGLRSKLDKNFAQPQHSLSFNFRISFWVLTFQEPMQRYNFVSLEKI
jgi:hypothetical protein